MCAAILSLFVYVGCSLSEYVNAKAGSGDPLNMPVARQDLLRAPYKRHFTPIGRWFPWLVGARDFDEELLGQWYSYFHQCSQCRRCAVYCPVGIDTAEFSQAAREIMHRIGIGQAYTDTVVVKAKRLGNNLGLPAPALRDTLSVLEKTASAVTRTPRSRPAMKKSRAECVLRMAQRPTATHSRR